MMDMSEELVRVLIESVPEGESAKDDVLEFMYGLFPKVSRKKVRKRLDKTPFFLSREGQPADKAEHILPALEAMGIKASLVELKLAEEKNVIEDARGFAIKSLFT